MKKLTFLIFTSCLLSVYSIAQNDLPDVTTSPVSEIGCNYAHVEGSSYGFEITVRGICYGTSPNVDINSMLVLAGSGGEGGFGLGIYDLSPETSYYIRAFATNSAGTSYGEEISFTTGVVPLPTVTTIPCEEIGIDYARVGGMSYGYAITSRGNCYSKKPNPTIDDQVELIGSGEGGWHTNINNLEPYITYYTRAFATNSAGTNYGEEYVFTTTDAVRAEVTTMNVTNVTNTSVTVLCNATGEDITERGICFNSNPYESPDITYEIIKDASVGSGDWTIQLNNLESSQTYYVRAYAKNEAGFGYGNVISFTIESNPLPTVTTYPVTNIMHNSVSVGGDTQGFEITERGVCYSTSPVVSINNEITLVGSGGFGDWHFQLEALSPETTYYLRAFATNSAGTSYGEEISFTTQIDPTQQNNIIDSLALVALYNATDGPNWTNNTGWLEDGLPITEWFGINEDGANSELLTINLSNNSLSGSIPIQIGDLLNFSGLNLSHNNLSGNIPSEMANIVNLKAINLEGNNLSGELPVMFKNLINLLSLDLHSNSITGNIPIEYGQLSNLIFLDLNRNQLTGSIPVEIGQLSNLTGLFLSENQLSGEIPSSIGQLSALSSFYVGWNNLEGNIPVELGQLTNLESLSLGNNQLSGVLPTSMGQLSKLQQLYIQSNNLSGNLIDVFGQLPNLQQFVVSNNNFSGVIPISICQPNLTAVDFSQNNFDSQSCPTIQCLLDKEVEFWGESNQIQQSGFSLINDCGTVSVPVNEQDSLALVALYDATYGPNWNNNGNWLIGSVSEWFGVTVEEGRVKNLNLSNNNLTGELPVELYDLTDLLTLYLHRNNISGEILPEIGQLSNLERLYLHVNQISGTIPSEIGQLANLTSLSLSSNQLTGSIPNELGKLANLSLLNLNTNQLIGNIPGELGQLTMLRRLSLGFNQLSGTIPVELSNLSTGNLVLRLNNNNLEGYIPIELGQMPNLLRLYVNDNNLSGAIPFEFCQSNISTVNFAANNFDDQSCPVIVCLNESNVTFAGDQLQTQKSGYSLIVDCGLNPNPCSVQDSLALVKLFNSTDGENWNRKENWLNNLVFTWEGVTVEDGRVVGLDLCDNNLNGELPAEFFNLTGLRHASFCTNNLSGNILEEIGEMHELNFLDFNENHLEGVLPISIGNCASLEHLYFENNNLGGSIPVELCNTPLQFVFFQGNNFNLQSCDAVQCLVDKGVTFYNDLWQRQQGGYSIFEECGIIPNAPAVSAGDSLALVELYKATDGDNWNNNDYWLSGYPVALWQGVRVEEGRVRDLYQLFENNMNGTLPEEFFSLTEIEHIVLWENPGLNGDLSGIGNFSNLHNVHIWNTNLGGIIPATIGECLHLQEFVIGGNNFEGTIPSELCNTEVYELNFEGNNFNAESCPAIECLQEKGAYFVGDIWQRQQDGFSLFEGCGLIPDVPSCDVQDSLALVALYNATDGHNWNNNDYWLSEYPVALWHGIHVENERVIEVHLTQNNMIGEIPEEFWNLTALQYLIFYRNKLSGNIPSDIWKLTELVNLSINYNELAGTLPVGLGQLTNLETLDFNVNDLTGEIPTELGQLINLRYLQMGSNQLEGEIPSVIWELTNLEILNLGYNNLSGSLAAEIGQLQNLQQLWLGGNDISGNIPAEIGELSVLERLMLNGNQLAGTIPAEIGQLTNLEILNLGNNQLDGEIPSIIDQMHSLLTLSLYRNQLTGQIPSSVGGLPNLRTLNLNTNLLTGQIPSALGQLISLTSLNLGDNQLSGSIPAELGYLSNLIVLNLRNNILSGQIPMQLGQLDNLRNLLLNNNQLSGNIPQELSNLASLRVLYLQSNQLTGEIPTGFGQLIGLLTLFVNENQLSGILPEDLCQPPFRRVDFSMNNFDIQSCPVIQCLYDKGVIFQYDPSQTQNSGISLVSNCVCEPTVVIRNITVYLNKNGEASITADDIDGGSNDNCGIDTLIASHTEFGCNNIGKNLVNLTLTNIYGRTATNQAIVMVEDNILPTASVENIEVSSDIGECGATIDISEAISATDNCGITSVTNNSPGFFPVGTTEVVWTVTDNGGNVVNISQFVTVTNDMPEIVGIDAPADPVDIINEISLTGYFSDNNLLSAIWDWGDSTTSVGVVLNDIQGSHIYQLPGVYTVQLAVVDMCGATDTFEHRYIVIYDPEGSFVTGGGIINSPLGASVQYPDATGMASFGFVSKYVKNKVNPDGNTKFKFKAGDLDFKSTEYDWLVVAVSKAMFKGWGTINGEGDYQFMISAIDGDVKEKGDPDIFRIKIWDTEFEEVVYDNEMGVEIDGDPSTAIHEGSIVIHDSQTKSGNLENGNSENKIPNEIKLSIYPNPFTNELNINMELAKESKVEIDLIAIDGRIVTKVKSAMFARGYQNISHSTKQLSPGIYFLTVKINNLLIKTKKLIKTN